MNLDELIPFEQVLDEELRHPEFRQEWERLAPARAIAHGVIAYRAEHGLKQSALARRLGMTQPAVSRLEMAEHLPSLDTLVRLSERLGLEIVVEISPPQTNGQTDGATALPTVSTRAVSPSGAGVSVTIR